MTISILFRLLELAEYQEKMVDASIYYKEAFGITPEKALENEEKLHQMEELVASLEAEVKRSLKKKKKKSIVSFLRIYLLEKSRILRSKILYKSCQSNKHINFRSFYLQYNFLFYLRHFDAIFITLPSPRKNNSISELSFKKEKKGKKELISMFLFVHKCASSSTLLFHEYILA